MIYLSIFLNASINHAVKEGMREVSHFGFPVYDRRIT